MTSNKRKSAKRTVKSPIRGPRDERGVLAQKILVAARRAFATRGYGATSMRSVARLAEVDSALVTYYFGSKAGLLDAALAPPPKFLETVAVASKVSIRSRGRAMITAMLAIWDEPLNAERLRSILALAAHEPIAMNRLRDVFAAPVIQAVSADLSNDERHLRASLVASQIVGLAMTRYVWRVGVLASIPSSRVVDLIAPTLQRYLNGALARLSHVSRSSHNDSFR